jgi:phage terminase large subunit-like protein
MKLVGVAVSRVARAAQSITGRALPWKEPGLSRVDKVLAFLTFLPITKGALVGTNMVLLPEQEEFVRKVYGSANPKTGLRAIKVAVQSEPKGNGKTGLLAGLGLCHLLGPEAEPRGEVYSAAVDRQQAGIMYNEMEAIILAVPEFGAACNLQRYHKKIEVMRGDGDGSFYEALSSDARRSHGLSPSVFVFDELAQVSDRALLDGLVNGLGKRPNALGIVISTQAPDDGHALSQLIDQGLSGSDPSIYVQLLAADPGEDPYAESTWRRVNPALGKFLSLEEMRSAARRAMNMPMFEPSFLNLRLNMRITTDTASRLVTRQVWESAPKPRTRKELRGQRCYGALDLSKKNDLTSLTLVFPDDEPDVGYDVLPFFWTPEESLNTRTQREQDLFRLWIKQGHLTTVPGPVIRYRYMAEQLARLKEEFDIVAVGYDRWRIEEFKNDLLEEGVELPLESFGQGFKDMSPAVEYFSELSLEKRLRHGDHPVLKSCVVNAITVSDPAGNLKVDKDKSNKLATTRIDGAVTLIMGVGVARRHVVDDPSARVDDFLAGAAA